MKQLNISDEQKKLFKPFFFNINLFISSKEHKIRIYRTLFVAFKATSVRSDAHKSIDRRDTLGIKRNP